ncbi:hypothetical protein ACJJJB_17975 [Microbulbifer sp. ANSA001]|uniref:hypothetical protein n=1 Tax=Microbulbifer sp. ANSA001 TaxID=3243358 RepID=UPI004042509F
MSADKFLIRFNILYPYRPSGRRVNRVVVVFLTLLLASILLILWLFLYQKSLDKPYVEIRGHRVASADNFDGFLRYGDNRERVQALSRYLASRGIANVVPVSSLLRQGGGWIELREPPFAIPPQSEWHNIVKTLTLLRDQIIPLIGSVDVVAGFRSDAYNRKLEHSDKAHHRDFCALDLIPKSNISHRELVEELRALHARLGPESNFGLGLSDGVRFHIDTCGYRIW